MTDTLEAELDHRYPLGETEPGDQRSAFLAGWVAGINFTRTALRSGRREGMKKRDWLWALLVASPAFAIAAYVWIVVLGMVFQ